MPANYPMVPRQADRIDTIGTGDSSRRRTRRPELTPAQRALGLLSRREHSRPELVRKLVARGIARGDALAAVELMTASGWQDDARYACSLARTRAGAGYGPLRIRAELDSHGIGAEAVAAAFTALAESGEDDWPGRARELVRRRFALSASSTVSLQRKAADFLIRRGFEPDCARIVISPRG